jgi:hypothetical protein
MKSFVIVMVGLAALLAGVNAGGYVAKGGVYDFKKPLDYYDQAVNAGKASFTRAKKGLKLH